MKPVKFAIVLLMALAIAVPAYALRPTDEQLRDAKASAVQQDAKVPVNQLAEQAASALATKGASPRVDWNSLTGYARTVTGIAEPVSASSFLRAHSALFGIKADLSGLSSLKVTDINGIEVNAYQQTHDGLPVFGGQVKVTSSQGAVRMVLAELLPDLVLDTKPAITAEQAVTAATGHLQSRRLVSATRGELGVLPEKGQGLLAYKVALRSDDPLGYYVYYIDARSGAVIRRSNEMPFVTGSGTVYLNNPVVGGTSTQSFTNLAGTGYLTGTYAKAVNEDVAGAYNASNVFSYTTTDTHFDENMAYFHVDRIHNYYKATLGYAGMDATMTATVHYGTNYANAYFSPSDGKIYFGDGDNSSIFDTAKEECVIYHEYTHAVTNKLVGLTYSGQSGAMSEGYSDYFSCSFTNDPIIGEYVMPSYKRVLTTHKTMTNWSGEVHADGEIWGHVLWECRSDASVGAAVMDKVTFTGISSLTSGATFVDGLNSILNADQSLYTGTHKTVIQNIFANHGIGSAPVAQNDAGSGADAGDTFAAALALSPGTYTCLLNTTDRNDYFKFSVTSGQVIKVKITPPSSADYDLYLYNPSQTQVGSSTGGAGVKDSVVYTATVSGTFYAKAYEYSGSGNYTLLISVGGGTTTPTLAISSTSWAPVAAGATSSAINVTNIGSTSVIAYTVSSNQTWLTVSSASGSTPGSFTMTAAANTGAARSATVTVTATTAGVSGSPKTIAVSQAAGTSGGTWTDVAATTQSAHPYANNYTYTWTITGPAGASQMKVYFDSIKTESGYDSVYVLNSAGTVIQKWSGTYRAVWSNAVSGNVIKIKIKTDASVTAFGFRSNKYSYYTAAAVRTMDLAGEIMGGPESHELLCQNSPNPVRAGTLISFNLPDERNVSLRIYNLNGQLVRTLVSEPQSAGYHQVGWDAKDAAGRRVATGMYVYRLTAGNLSATKKLTVVK